MKTIKLFSYKGFTKVFDNTRLFKYNLVMINNQRYLKQFSSFNNNYIISSERLQTDIKLSDAIKYYNVIWCSTINEIVERI